MAGVDRLAILDPRRWWLFLIGIALFVQIAWAISLASRKPRFDEIHYISHAKNLAEGKGYVDEFGQPTAYWPVGYPAVLAMCYRLAGDGPLTAVMLQIILGVATSVLVCVIGSNVFGARIGRSAALFLALYPTHVFYATLRLTEPLFTALVVTAMLFLLVGLARRWALIAGGLMLGSAALVRPLILLFPLVLPIWFWIAAWPRRKILSAVALVGCCTVLVVSPWLVRNHQLTGSWFVLSTTGGENFWVGNHPGAFGGYARPREILDDLQDGKGYDYSRGYHLGLVAISNSPVQTAIRTLQKVTYFFALETDGVLWNLKGLPSPPPKLVTLSLLAVANVTYLFLLCFAVLGLMPSARVNPLASLLLLLAGYSLLITIIFFGDPRYHYAVVPLAAIFSTKGFLEDWPRLSKGLRSKDPAARRTVLVWGAIVAVLLLAVVANVALKVAEARTMGLSPPL